MVLVASDPIISGDTAFGLGFLFMMLLGVAAVVLFFWALFSIILDKGLQPAPKLLWVIVVLLLPVIGPLLWIFLGHKVGRHTTPLQPGQEPPPWERKN